LKTYNGNTPCMIKSLRLPFTIYYKYLSLLKNWPKTIWTVVYLPFCNTWWVDFGELIYC